MLAPMDPLPDEQLGRLDDAHLRSLVQALERRQPPVTIDSVAVRPDRRPWTYRDIWHLEGAQRELARRIAG